MDYEEKKKLADAAMVLKECCKEHVAGVFEKCDCIFAEGASCSLHNAIPKNYKIHTISRWTPEDVALAKALIVFGIESIFKNDDAEVYLNDKTKFTPGWRYRIPDRMFKDLGKGELVDLKKIVKTAEQQGD